MNLHLRTSSGGRSGSSSQLSGVPQSEPKLGIVPLEHGVSELVLGRHEVSLKSLFGIHSKNFGGPFNQHINEP